MIFQAFATVILLCIAGYALSQARVAPVVTKFVIAVTMAGQYLVLFPSHATDLAVLFGIGRGADLVFYIWVLLSVVMVLNLHLRLRGVNDRLVALTRELALRDASATESRRS